MVYDWLMMAASGAAETFGFVINHGPQPNSPDIMNNSCGNNILNEEYILNHVFSFNTSHIAHITTVC